MEPLISKLVRRYETGLITRRELIGGLAMLATASGTSQAAAAQGVGLDHVSVVATNPQRAADFYQSVFGFPVVREDLGAGTIRLGRDRPMVTIRGGNTPGVIDHFAIGVAPFDKDAIVKALRDLKIPSFDEAGAGFHVRDPDGIRVQIMPGTTK